MRRFSEIQFSPRGARMWGEQTVVLPGADSVPAKIPANRVPEDPGTILPHSHNSLHWGGYTYPVWGSLLKVQLGGVQPSLPCFRRSGLLSRPRRFGGDKLQPRGSARPSRRADASCGIVDKEPAAIM